MEQKQFVPLTEQDMWTEEERIDHYEIETILTIVSQGLKNNPEKEGEIRINLSPNLDFFKSHQEEIMKRIAGIYQSMDNFKDVVFLPESDEIRFRFDSA